MLGNKRILYAVVDPFEIRIRHPLLFKRIFDLTFVLAQRLSTKSGGDVRYFDTIEEALSNGRIWDIVILQSVGNFVIEYRLLDELDSFCEANPNFAVLAFPPARPTNETNAACDLHGGMIVLNVDAWRRLGLLELQEPAEVSEGPRGSLAAHLKPPVPRESILDALLSAGGPVHYFAKPFLDCSVYIWPEFESERLYDGLVKRDESLVSNFDQKRWIRLSQPQSAIWIFNSEPYRFHAAIQNCDTYFGPAAGFKFLDMLSYNPGAEFTFYDQNVDSLDWIRTTKSTWDGDDFPAYVARQPEAVRQRFKYVNASIQDNQRILWDGFGGEGGFKRLWRLFRSANAKYFKCDLFDAREVAELISGTDAKRPFFYYSNIFSTNFTLSVFSREEAERRYAEFRSTIMSKFPGAVLHGADVSGRWR